MKLPEIKVRIDDHGDNIKIDENQRKLAMKMKKIAEDKRK